MSRDVDVSVAEALGYSLNKTDHTGQPCWIRYDGVRMFDFDLPDYSTDIAAAIGARDGFLEASDRMTKIRFFEALRNSVSSRRGGMTDIRDVSFYMNAEDICAAILAANAGEGKG